MLGMITFYIYQMANEIHEAFLTDEEIEENDRTFMAAFNLGDNKR